MISVYNKLNQRQQDEKYFQLTRHIRSQGKPSEAAHQAQRSHSIVAKAKYQARHLKVVISNEFIKSPARQDIDIRLEP